MDISSLVDSLHPLEIRVITAFGQQPSGSVLRSEQIALAAGLEASQLSMAIEWLLTKDLIVVESETVTPVVSLTKIGEDYFEHSAPIERILSAAREAAKSGRRLTIQDIQSREGLEPSEISGAIGCLKKEGAVLIVRGGCIEATGRPSPTAEALRTVLQQLRGTSRELDAFPDALRRVIQQHAVKRGQRPRAVPDRRARDQIISPDPGGRAGRRTDRAAGRGGGSLAIDPRVAERRGVGVPSGSESIPSVCGPPRVAAGKRHPYREFLDLVKNKLVSMGFQEMRGPLVETEFWNMDALFMPQFHPARDIHDVYFVKEPTHARSDDPQNRRLRIRVAATHESGGKTGSTGWGYRFDMERTLRLVLRSQGTAVSARTLASNPSVPGKYFSIARCFRYDAVDATHATDFFQVEGIVLGEDINFRTLLGLLDLFAREVAQAKESKFLPAYFPFTEPSVELHVRHPRLGWMELGGAGLFRPEVTLPLGVTVPVIAWGLGLDRMAMVALGIHDIRDLFTRRLGADQSHQGKILSDECWVMVVNSAVPAQ
ncbi:MAG: phenylalanine--tRNA ligase alpha subunit [Nitrospiraceae bacterium]|nr:MAG: phenylalanine--tRNA ligase alpha subunit [Nitrospiraceae bacterium]